MLLKLEYLSPIVIQIHIYVFGSAVSNLAIDISSKLPNNYRPLSSSLFTGRVEILRKIEEHFVDQGPGQHTRREFLLYGTGGAGKTQIALKFAENNNKRRAEREPIIIRHATNR